MFRSDTREAQENQIIINDADPDTVQEMLLFIYTGAAPNINSIAYRLLPLADKYALEGLLKSCVSVLTGSISIENVVSLLVLSDTYHIDSLKEIAVHFLCKNSSEVVKSENWKMMLQYPHLLSDAFQAMSDLCHHTLQIASEII